MNKINSLDFLQSCIKRLNQSNETERQKMKQVYTEENIKYRLEGEKTNEQKTEKEDE